MNSYVLLLRGINVGGKNKLPMAELRHYLEESGFSNVATYIASGNILLQSTDDAEEVQARVEKLLPQKFNLDSEIVKVLVLSLPQLQAVIDAKPRGFGDLPDKYHSDAIFLMGITADEAISVFSPREGVDKVWPGKGVIYSQRLSALRTKSRLNRIIASPLYQSMTIRNWNTTTKLLELLKTVEVH